MEAERKQRERMQNLVGRRYSVTASGRGGSADASGTVTRVVGRDMLEVKITSVTCDAFLCTGIGASTCTGNESLETGYYTTYITVPAWCAE